MLASQRSHCHGKTNSGFVDSSEGVGRKGQRSSTADKYRAGILDRHRDWQISEAQSQQVMDVAKKGRMMMIAFIVTLGEIM